jgi:hypothetical protein
MSCALCGSPAGGHRTFADCRAAGFEPIEKHDAAVDPAEEEAFHRRIAAKLQPQGDRDYADRLWGAPTGRSRWAIGR